MHHLHKQAAADCFQPDHETTPLKTASIDKIANGLTRAISLGVRNLIVVARSIHRRHLQRRSCPGTDHLHKATTASPSTARPTTTQARQRTLQQSRTPAIKEHTGCPHARTKAQCCGHVRPPGNAQRRQLHLVRGARKFAISDERNLEQMREATRRNEQLGDFRKQSRDAVREHRNRPKTKRADRASYPSSRVGSFRCTLARGGPCPSAARRKPRRPLPAMHFEHRTDRETSGRSRAAASRRRPTRRPPTLAKPPLFHRRFLRRKSRKTTCSQMCRREFCRRASVLGARNEQTQRKNTIDHCDDQLILATTESSFRAQIFCRRRRRQNPDSALFLSIPFSSSFNSTVMIFSTPLPPMTTGTPMNKSFVAVLTFEISGRRQNAFLIVQVALGHRDRLSMRVRSTRWFP